MIGISIFSVYLKISNFKIIAKELVIDPQERQLAIIRRPKTIAGGSKSIIHWLIVYPLAKVQCMQRVK